MEGTYSVSSGSTELCEMFEEQERRRSIASKQSTFSADTSFQSIGGSLNSWGARRPSSATSYSFGSISGGYPRHASISSVGTSSAGVSSGAGAKTNAGGNQGNSGSGCNPSLGKVGIAEENHSISQRESSQQLRTIETGKQSDGPALSPTSSPASVELIHPGMEIFNPDTGRCPTTERQNPTPPLHSGSLVSPRIPEAKLATSFNPTHSFFITRTGTPGLNKEIADGKSHRMHLLRSRGWEIRDMSGAIKRGSETGGKYQRVGSGGIGGNNQHAEFILETVTEEVFGSWGSWTDAVSHTPWRQSLDSSMLSPTPSTPSLFSHFRSSIPPNSPPLIASTPTSRPSVDTRNGSVSGPFQFPPDPTYVSLKTSPASSKSTFYSIETAPLFSGDPNTPALTRESHTAYPSETDRIQISEWKVPYNVNSPSTVTLVSNDYHHNQGTGHKPRPQKNKKVEVWADPTNLRTQFFEMDRSTYKWEFRMRPKIRIPLNAAGPAPPLYTTFPGTQSPRIPFPPSPLLASAINSQINFGLPTLSLKFSQEKRVIKFRSEVLVLEKEVDGVRSIVGEYYFVKNLKSITTLPASPPSRFRRFVPSPVSPSSPASAQQDPSINLSSLRLSNVEPSTVREKEKVQYINIAKHHSGILLLDSRAVNKVIAMNSLLIALKREKQRKVVTLNASNNKVRRRRWGYGLWGSGTGENGAESPNEENQAEGDASGAEGAHSARHPGDRQIMGSLSGSGGAAIDGDEPGEGNNDGQDNDVEEYSLQEDDWEWHDTEGWVRKAHNIDGGRGGVG